MRLQEMPNGRMVNLDAVLSVDPINICKHDATFNNYEVYVNGMDSVNVMERELPRETLLQMIEATP